MAARSPPRAQLIPRRAPHRTPARLVAVLACHGVSWRVSRRACAGRGAAQASSGPPSPCSACCSTPSPPRPPPPSPRPHNPPIPPPAPKPGPPPAARPRPPRRWHMLMGQVTATRTRPDSRMYDGIRAALPGDASPLARVRRPEPARPPPRLDRRTGWCRRGSRDTLGSNAACAPPSVTWF